MEVTIVKEGGFCLGVRLALEKARKALKGSGKAYALSPLVHNEEVVARLEEEGLEIRKLEDIPPGSPFPLVLSAHGHPASLEGEIRKRGLSFVDASCPFVLSNEKAIEKDSQEHDIVYVGHEGHEEAIAAVSFARGRAFLFDPRKKEEVPDGLVAPAIYVQTTLSGEEVEKALRLIREKYPDALFRKGRCRATEERQEAVKRLGEEYDLIVIVGSSTSSNARALLSTSRLLNPKALSLLALNAAAFPLEAATGRKKAALIGAASTDDREIEEIARLLKTL